MEILDFIRNDVRKYGFLSAPQVVLKIATYFPGTSEKDIKYVLENLECNDIYKIQYTNSYVSTIKMKDLFYYDPRVKDETADK